MFLDLSIPYRKNIQSPGVVYREYCVTRFKVEETDHIPGDYLVTLFSFGGFIRQENPSYRFLKNGNNIIAFLRNLLTRTCVDQINPDLK